MKNEKKSAPVEQGLPVKYYVLNPDRGVPTSGADQGYENYFPSADPEENPQFNYYNGMSGTGLTAETWADLAGGNGRLTIGDELEDTASGVAGTGELDAASRQALDTAFGLSEKYGEYNYEIVWYVVKIQDGKGETGPDANGDAADVHVDGYIKGVPVEVRYHQHYGACHPLRQQLHRAGLGRHRPDDAGGLHLPGLVRGPQRHHRYLCPGQRDLAPDER